MQLGFVLDQKRCIGCHACTVACKSENDVPLGSFRTWVKYTEEGAFPQVKRSFTVLRCNQCTDAPCVTICPTTALEKRPDGIVDVDPVNCIGCKSCMQACPYDALYINEDSGTAQKCHFCAHRTEQGLAPACAVVCPTEAIIPGDFDDPESRVSQMKATGELTARKTEAGTQPNVWYHGATEAGTAPLQTQASGGYIWSNQLQGEQRAADEFRALESKAQARTTYDVEHAPLWGWKVSAYLLTKSLSAGAGLAALAVALTTEGGISSWGLGLAALAGLVWLGVTTALLVLDLKRPERFLKILLRPNWDSWLAKGSIVLMAYGGLLTAWFAAALMDAVPTGAASYALAVPTIVAGALTAGYTAFLFGQAKGRALWLERGLFWHLVVQAVAAGAALLIVLQSAFELSPEGSRTAQWLLTGALGAHLIFAMTAGSRAPHGREAEYEEAHALLVGGPYRKMFVASLALAVGGIVFASPFLPAGAAWTGGVLAILGLGLFEHAFVRAGQALRIS